MFTNMLKYKTINAVTVQTLSRLSCESVYGTTSNSVGKQVGSGRSHDTPPTKICEILKRDIGGPSAPKVAS